ncbi:MAG TPA: hypothetical protein VL400_11260 [Polyangiaceae bacterium]|jgi:hypothetical protein|nr:hypothetical protein [Polyangiaceae bacterium]
MVQNAFEIRQSSLRHSAEKPADPKLEAAPTALLAAVAGEP